MPNKRSKRSRVADKLTPDGHAIRSGIESSRFGTQRRIREQYGQRAHRILYDCGDFTIFNPTMHNDFRGRFAADAPDDAIEQRDLALADKVGAYAQMITGYMDTGKQEEKQGMTASERFILFTTQGRELREELKSYRDNDLARATSDEQKKAIKQRYEQQDDWMKKQIKHYRELLAYGLANDEAAGQAIAKNNIAAMAKRGMSRKDYNAAWVDKENGDSLDVVTFGADNLPYKEFDLSKVKSLIGDSGIEMKVDANGNIGLKNLHKLTDKDKMAKLASEICDWAEANGWDYLSEFGSCNPEFDKVLAITAAERGLYDQNNTTYNPKEFSKQHKGLTGLKDWATGSDMHTYGNKEKASADMNKLVQEGAVRRALERREARAGAQGKLNEIRNRTLDDPNFGAKRSKTASRTKQLGTKQFAGGGFTKRMARRQGQQILMSEGYPGFMATGTAKRHKKAYEDAKRNVAQRQQQVAEQSTNPTSNSN